jgi:hypothetical protein
MSILRLLTSLAVLAAPTVAFACSCLWGGPFTKVALRTDLVVLAEVRSYYRHSMDVAVVEILKGAEERATIRIWGDTGALCRPYVTTFPPGTRWIFALQRQREPGGRDYTISVCGDFWLEVRGGQAVGRVAVAEHGPINESVPLADMLTWIRSGGAAPLVPLPITTRPSR